MTIKDGADEILKEILYEDWMSDDEFEQIKKEYITNYDSRIEDDLKNGVNNGYSVEYQVDLIKKMIRK